mmetsp:Transcript_32771/g.23705  ORF Transcript_32771/g.23705 Transcript_32771/m.23705 type:complete len:152 (+) Transcript_32771:2167-2622(+)
MAKPSCFVFTAICGSILQGGAGSVVAIWIVYMMFSMMIPDKTLMWDTTGKYVLAMIGTACISFIGITTMKISFGILGENIAFQVRKTLYFSILKRPPGWFDEPSHQAGVMTTLLSSEVQLINGASTEATSVMVQASVTMLTALIISLYYCW